MQELNASIRRSSIWVMMRLVISLSVGAFITTYIIRSLAVVEYGIYNLLYSFIGFVSVIAAFGIPSVFQRFVPEALEKKEYSLLKQLVRRGLILRLALSLLTVSIVLIFHEPIGLFLKVDGWISYFGVFAWGIVIYLEASLLTSVLHSLFLHKYSVIAGTLYTVFRGGCVFVVLQGGWGIRGVLWAEVAAWSIWLLLQYFFFHTKFYRLHTGEGTGKFPLSRYLRYGGFSMFNEFGNSILGVSTDYFIITAFLGPGAVAFYAFADRVIRLFVNCMPHVLLIDVIRPSFFVKYSQSQNKQQLVDMFNLLVKLGAFCIFPLAAGIFILGDKMIAYVFKPEYLPAQHILWIMMVFTAINVFAQPAGLVLKAVEQVQITMYSKIFAVYNVVAALLVIQKYGVLGVVLATCSAHLMTNLFIYYFARKYADLRVDWRGLMAIAINVAIMSLFLLLIRPFATNLYTLTAVAIAGCGVYAISAWANKAFNVKERKWVNSVVPKPVFVF